MATVLPRVSLGSPLPYPGVQEETQSSIPHSLHYLTALLPGPKMSAAKSDPQLHPGPHTIGVGVSNLNPSPKLQASVCRCPCDKSTQGSLEHLSSI